MEDRAAEGNGPVIGDQPEDFKGIAGQLVEVGAHHETSPPKAVSPNGLWESVFQQDASYPGRANPNIAISAFFDRLGAKGGPGSPDIWKSIFWLQQRPAEPSAEAAYTHGRRGYLVEFQSQVMPATRLYNELTG